MVRKLYLSSGNCCKGNKFESCVIKKEWTFSSDENVFDHEEAKNLRYSRDDSSQVCR